MDRCFLCHRRMDEKTGLCTNLKCIRSKPLSENKLKDDEEKEGDVTTNGDT